MSDSIHSLTYTNNKGEEVPLSQYAGKVLLIVNTASKCGFTPQYEGLEALYKQFQNDGLEIIGFPCDQFGGQEPGEDVEIEQFCQLNYGVSFPLSTKIEVNGNHAHPVFAHLKNAAPGLLGSKGIKWNFTKFLISKDGKVLKRYGSTSKPASIASDISKALEN